MRSVRLLAATLLVPGLAAVAGSLALTVHGPAAPAAASTAPCVGVVVDARLAGGPLRTGCAKGDPGSGLAALTAAGFGYAFVPRQPGLVCQVDGRPACSRTTSSTYWSYWYRARGSSRWVYASQGAGSHDPAPGSTEAWVWQDGGRRQPPSIAQATICPATVPPSHPPGPAATAPAATTAVRGTAGSRTARPAPAAGRTQRATVRTSPPPSTTAAPATAAPATSASPPEPGSSSPTLATAAGRAPHVDDTGRTPWLGPVVGLGAVALLGGAAVARSRRTGPRR